MTDAGNEAARDARNGAVLIWRDRGRQHPGVGHRLESLIAGRGLAPSWRTGHAAVEAVYPALSPAVLGLAERIPPRRLVAVRGAW